MDLDTSADLISVEDSLSSNACTATSDYDHPSSVSDDPDADEYARSHGLTVDSLRLDPWKGLLQRDICITATLVQTEFGELIESKEPLEELAFRPLLGRAEQWFVSAESLTLLEQVCKPCTDREVAEHMAELCFTETAESKLKIEQPILRSDHQADCRGLKRRIKALRKVSLPDHHLPLHPVEIEQGEGLEFPESARKGDEALVDSLSRETIEVTKDTLMFLVQSLKADWGDDEQRNLMESISTYSGLNSVEHVTPPLSPRTRPEPKYFIPDDKTCAIPIPSDPTSSLSADLEAVEGRILSKDNVFWSGIASQKSKSPDRYDDIDISGMIRAGEFSVPRSSSSSPELIARDFKIEVPLLPDDSLVILDKAPPRVMLLEDLKEAKDLMAGDTVLSSREGELDGRLNDFFEETATRVMRSVEQEQLQPLDATARVTAPVMDFSIPVCEWDEHLWTAQIMFEWIRKTTDVDWQGIKWRKDNIKEQQMVWVPMAHMAEKQLVTEAVEVVPSVLAFFLEEPWEGEIQTSADFVHTQPGLLFLRGNEDDEDELPEQRPREPSAPPSKELVLASMSTKTVRPCSRSSQACQAQPSMDVQIGEGTSLSHRAMLQSRDLTSLLRGKKRQLELVKHQSSSPVTVHSIRALDMTNQDVPNLIKVLKGLEDNFTDYSSLVENFVEMNTPKKVKLSHSRFFARPALPQPESAVVPNTKPTEPDAQAAPALIPAISPDIVPPKNPPRIIVSAAVSSIITSHLEKLVPGIDLIVRDHERLRAENVPPGSKQPNCDEADFVLSPATGIILTTMVKLRQKPLPAAPGQQQQQQQQQPTFRNVVENVAMRHERLIVLISEGNNHSETMDPLSQSDVKALVEFQSFASALQAQTDVHIAYVGGGAETLAKWMAAIICDHATEAQEWQSILLPVETGWELFLRRAGMNVVAAQVVLGMLRVPDDEVAIGGKEGKLYGLPAFLMMSRDERAERFAEIFGGRRLLDAVSAVIDEPWGDKNVIEVDNSGLSQEKEVVDVFSDDIGLSGGLGADDPMEQSSDGFGHNSSPWE